MFPQVSLVSKKRSASALLTLQRARKESDLGFGPHFGSVGALIIRIGFLGIVINMIRSPPKNSIGNYLGPYFTLCFELWGLGD